VKKVIVLIAASFALILTGCSQVGVAAQIGDTKITQSLVQKSIDEALSERAKVDTSAMQLESGAAFNRNQLRFHVISVLLSAVAADEKVSVTKAEIDTRRAEILSQVGGEAKLPAALVGASIAPRDFDEYIQLILYSEKIAAVLKASGVADADTGTEIQKMMVAKAKALKVTINPRYGVWDSVAGDIVSGDAANPAATPAASPTATK
jgi:hypothetical protein